jgi:hypothetical protein
MVFSTKFSNKKKPKSDKRKKIHPMNLDKSFCTCLAWLGTQIGPCHLISEVTNKMTDYLTSGPFDGSILHLNLFFFSKNEFV